MLRVRLSMHDAHYDGGLVDGSLLDDDRPGDVDDDAGLAGSRAGKNQQGTAEGMDRIVLSGVETLRHGERRYLRVAASNVAAKLLTREILYDFWGRAAMRGQCRDSPRAKKSRSSTSLRSAVD